jgi:hypothetical protein
MTKTPPKEKEPTREELVKKLGANIRALLRKVVDGGATKEEAHSALMKAHELVDKYDLGLYDISPDPVHMTPEVARFWMDRAGTDLAGPWVLLDEIETFVRRFVGYPSDHAAVAHVLWCAHTHLMGSWYTTPRLAFMSPEKESGKSRALEISSLIVPSPILSINLSRAYLVRRVSKGQVTILRDEIDAIFGTTKAQEVNAEVCSIFNGGYRRGAKVHLCKATGNNDASFAPIAFAGLKMLPDTLASRSIFIHMKRNAPDEKLDEFRWRKVEPQGHALRRRLAAWCANIAETVSRAEPEMPDGIRDRKAECWEPLFAVADAAGGEWPERARAASVYLSENAEKESMSPGVELLRHIRDAFGYEDKLFTVDVLARLINRPESPWKDIKGKQLSDLGLADRLKLFEIKSKDVRIGATNKKGYVKEHFYDAWRRYCPDPSYDIFANENNDVADVALVADKCGACDGFGCPTCKPEGHGLPKRRAQASATL